MKRPSTNHKLEPLSPREKIAHLFSRLAFGPRPGDVERVLKSGTSAWLDEQLQVKASTNPDLRERLSEFETIDLSVADCSEFIAQNRADRGATEEEKKAAKRLKRLPMGELMQAVALRAVLSERQASEVMVDFWRNHFNVSFTKGDRIYSQINDYEREVIRGNVWRDFPTMLRDSATHPAMLNYLDNHLSRSPPSKQELKEIERRAKRKTGSETQAA